MIFLITQSIKKKKKQNLIEIFQEKELKSIKLYKSDQSAGEDISMHWLN